MEQIIISIITLLVGSAVFITGMNMMSSGLKKATGKGLKRLLKKTQNNPFACVGIGTAVTALIQSSAATSVMSIGFVAAGVMTVYQAFNIVMGAYVGTTVTGVLASLSSFKFSQYLVLLAFIGVILMFFKKEKIKNIGEICCGLGLLFFGLSTMSGAIEGNTDLLEGISNLFAAVDFPLLLVLIGCLFTALVQSSSANAGVVIVLLGQGAISLENGFYLVIGGTIGTIITTFIATIGSTADTKRVAVSALMTRIISAIIAIAIIWPLENLAGAPISNFFRSVFGNDSFALAMFLVIYNIIFVGIQLPFGKIIVKFATLLVKDKAMEKQQSAIKFIDMHLINTPSIAMMQVKNEIINMMELSYENYKNGYLRLMNGDESNDQNIIDIEDKIDYINSTVSNFLIALTNKVSQEDEVILGSYFHVINDIERIGDHAYNFYEMSISMKENDLNFSEIANQEMGEMNDVILKMFDLALNIFKTLNKGCLKELHELEDVTDKLKGSLSAKHFERITKNQCTNELSPYYSTLISELERVADHLVNIGYSIVDPTGDAVEDK